MVDPPRKLITSFYRKVNKAPLPQQTNEKTNVKLKEKEGSRIQEGDLEKNDNANDHGVDEDGEPDKCLARDSEKRAAGSIVKGTELTLVGPLGFVPVDEVVKVVEEKIYGNLCSMLKSQLSAPGSLRLRRSEYGNPGDSDELSKVYKKAEAFTDLMLNNGLRFVNGRSKSSGAAKAAFDNGRSQSVIDYVMVNVEAWSATLDMAVVSRIESDHDPLALSMRLNVLGLGNMVGQAPGFYEREIVLTNCRKRIRWDEGKYLQDLPQLKLILADYGQFISDALPTASFLILAKYDAAIG
ncbi:hypothetical protein NDU88_001745 [Pleurodeles waltl]|uniref:Uncharacterized protein n=1 Tax=Pleurodeles waltl TaxID=8319 RepID=A0AAV7UTL4_PLEWA|nr:hypothetical protein NDU88_001745 [Pleurodeles waltl]